MVGNMDGCTVHVIYKHIPFTPKKWREQAKNGKTPTGDDGKALPQGIVVGCTGNTTAMVDTGDVHVLMVGAAGVGKTAFWLYPCIEYACASGMSFFVWVSWLYASRSNTLRWVSFMHLFFCLHL